MGTIFCHNKNSKMKLAILAILASAVTAFVAPGATQRASTTLDATRGEFISAAAAIAFAGVAPANAVRDYENVGYLGGSNIVDINNANIRVYLKMPGMYPGVAGKIVTNGPYKSVGDVYNIKGLSSAEKEVLKKYESRFIVN